MAEKEPRAAPRVGLHLERETGGREKVEHETQHVAHGHRHRGPQMGIGLGRAGAQELYQQIVNGILQQRGSGSDDGEAHHLAQLTRHNGSHPHKQASPCRPDCRRRL